MRLLFVGDGKRDAAMTPPLVETIVGGRVAGEAIEWPRPHRAGQGYDRKLLFALHRAREQGLDGLVATVDRDRSAGRDRLRSLEAARTQDRQLRPSLPTALGCANPHAEAWLLDDPRAVCDALRLKARTPVPNVRKLADPKQTLNDLHAGSPRAKEPMLLVLAEIAGKLDPARCTHAGETGFGRFVEEVRREIAPVARTPSGA